MREKEKRREGKEDKGKEEKGGEGKSKVEVLSSLIKHQRFYEGRDGILFQNL